MEMVTTCHGRNLPLSCKAVLAAYSSPPQHGTSMRTIVTLLMSFALMISVNFPLLIDRIQLWTADQGHMPLDKFFMEGCISICRTVCRDQKTGTVKIWCLWRRQFDTVPAS